MIFAWVYPFVLTIVPHFAKLGRIGYSAKYKMCTHDNLLPTSEFYSLIAGVGVIIPVFIAIVIIYIRIYLFVSRHNAKMAVVAMRPVSTSAAKSSSTVHDFVPSKRFSHSTIHGVDNVATSSGKVMNQTWIHRECLETRPPMSVKHQIQFIWTHQSLKRKLSSTVNG